MTENSATKGLDLRVTLADVDVVKEVTMKNKLNWAAIGVLALIVLVQVLLSTPRSAAAFDGKVGSDSAAVSVATSADGNHVYICDPKHCFASHDAGKTFVKLKVD